MKTSLSRNEGLFESVLSARKSTKYEAGKRIFSQGDDCSDVYYIERGVVKLTLVSKRGRGAVLGILGPGDFIGEGCITAAATHATSAVAIVASTLLTIEPKSITELLEHDAILAKRFIHYLIERQQRIEQDLIDHLFNSSEKRLARTLWLLSEYSKEDNVPPILEKSNRTRSQRWWAPRGRESISS
jgi:CRP/FNR family cyclic AMP-dependent transcriptional regulator